MNKLATLLTVVIVTGFATVQMMDSQPEVSGNPWGDEQRIRDKITAYECFKYTLESTIDDLRRGNIRLKEAQSRILVSARQFNPEFLAHLRLSESGGTDAERVARNLVEHVATVEEFLPPKPCSHGDLTGQLQEMLDQLCRKEPPCM